MSVYNKNKFIIINLPKECLIYLSLIFNVLLCFTINITNVIIITNDMTICFLMTSSGFRDILRVYSINMSRN